MGRKKLAGKSGFYLLKTELKYGRFYKYYNHKRVETWESNRITALHDPEKGEVILYSRKDDKYLIIKTDVSILKSIAKVMFPGIRLQRLIDLLFERHILTTNSVWSTLEYKLIDKGNPENKSIRLMTVV